MRDRALLFDLDRSIQRLNARVADDPALVSLTGVYHNLLRQWADIVSMDSTRIRPAQRTHASATR